MLQALRDKGGVHRLRHLSQHHRRPLLQLASRTGARWSPRTVDIIGIDHVGIGTDRSHNFTKPDYDWMRMGRWTRGVDYGAASAARPGKAPPPAWFTEVHHLGLHAGRPEARSASTPAEVEKITNGNWLRLYRDVFGAAEQVREARLEFVQTDPVLATTPRAAAS